MDRIRTEWAGMSTVKKGFYGLLIAGALVFLAMSLSGSIEMFSVDSGVVPVP